MKLKVLLFAMFLVPFVSTSNAETKVPDNAIRIIKEFFPNCEPAQLVTGSLYGARSVDIAVVLGCNNSGNSYSVLRRIVVFTSGSNGMYRIASQTEDFSTEGIYDFYLETRKNSLFVHVSIPGSQIASVYDYQFKKIGSDLILIGMETQSFYHGDGPQDESAEDFHVSANYLTGVVKDSRYKEGKNEKIKLEKIKLQEFYPGFGS